MLYKKNSEKALDKKLFAQPTCEYRGTPFWAWNCKLETGELMEQIEMLKEMGMGGFHMHVRTGMDSTYLTDEFMGHIKSCVEKAKKEDMLAWLYDEDRWPSGAAGGIVTKNKEYVAKNLLFTPLPYGKSKKSGKPSGNESGRGGAREENGTLVAVYDVELNADGTLKRYAMIDADASAKGAKWYAYNEPAVPSPWFNNEAYVSTINPEAIKKFIEVTHERYNDVVGDDFGKTIPAIFTDEPQFASKGTLSFANEKKDVFMPWVDTMPETFKAAYGQELLPYLPELFWELPGGAVSAFRYKFHDHVTELFASAFCDTLGNWCEAHNIMLGGHLMAEQSLYSQTRMIGEAMRCYRAFKDMPGIDILCDRHEYNTAKQCQSALHQQGGEAMLSELYGVTGWDYDFRGHKLQGDWQAALGVTVRVPHLTWMSMKGEAKRDYPACIGYQSPWYDQYALVEDHFARLNTALTRGKPAVKVAVVHPIESYWLYWGPSEQTAIIRDQLEENFDKLTETLLFGLVDFNFICESRLPRLCEKAGAPLQIGAMQYDTIIVPACHTLRSTTLDRLEAFRDAGGKLIFLGDCPAYLDAVPSDRPRKLFARSMCLSFSSATVLNALEEDRFLDIRNETGARTTALIYQLREDGDGKWLFIANGKNPVSPDVDPADQLKITLKGEYKVELYDTLTGKISELPASYENGNTVITRVWHMHDSMLLRLTAGKLEGAYADAADFGTPSLIAKKVPVVLEEPNAVLLDMAEYSFDDGPLQPEEEILRLDNECRRKLGIPLRKKHVTQPYLLNKETPAHRIALRFTIPSEVEVAQPLLALEDAAESKIKFNGIDVPSKAVGWYVDKAIETVKLPPIRKGDNILEIALPLGARTNLEWFYLLGDFGVRVDGRIKTVVAPVRELAFGSFTHQGLPFYTGNLTYKFTVDAPEGKIAIRTPQYRGALIGVEVDGERKGSIAFSPYVFAISGLEKGKHEIGLKFYGTRQNGFAQVHHTQGVYFYQSPDSWRSDGDLWVYEYQLKEFGILKSPEIFA